MRYWHADWPDAPISLAYDDVAHQAAHARLTRLVSEIAAVAETASEEAFPKTEDNRSCLGCRFQVYCDRAIEGVGDSDRRRPHGDASDEALASVDEDRDTEAGLAEHAGW